MMKQPMRLTASVPHGKNVLHEVFISVEMMYRIAPPMKLPMPTMSVVFSILGECIGVMSVRPRWGRESGRGILLSAGDPSASSEITLRLLLTCDLFEVIFV